MSAEEKRKIKSESLLQHLEAEYLPTLPLIESEEETTIRTAYEIGKRIICLLCITAYANGAISSQNIQKWLALEDLLSALSEEEISLLEDPEMSQEDKIKYSWKIECIWLLLWSVNKLQRSLPTQECSLKEVLEVVPAFGADTTEFMSGLKLRDKSEILDMSDFLYRAHWTTRQKRIDNITKTGKLNPSVVAEWHYTINWITRYNDNDNWDEVATDT